MRVYFLIFFLTNYLTYAQDLMELLNTSSDSVIYTTATFKNTRVINAHSIETIAKKHLEFRISHRFGRLNSGAYELWGLDQAQIRWGLEYGITDKFNIGIGRSSFQKVYDGYMKYKILSQKTGIQTTPITITLLATATIQTLRVNTVVFPDYPFHYRLTYVSQLIVARKFSERFSLQINPTVLHRNGVMDYQGFNTIIASAIASRLKLTRRVAINAEYFYVLPNQLPAPYTNALSVGFDIETGGHVFQLHFTNSQSMIEKGVIAETTGQWLKGDIFYGFNISRMFSFNK